MLGSERRKYLKRQECASADPLNSSHFIDGGDQSPFVLQHTTTETKDGRRHSLELKLRENFEHGMFKQIEFIYIA